MREPNCETLSVLRYVFTGGTRLSVYAHFAKKQGLSYRRFVEMLEVARRDVMKTPDGVLMNPECNEKLDLVAITQAWASMRTARLASFYA